MRETFSKTRTHAKQMRRNLTKAEAIMWKSLRLLKIPGANFRRQHPIPPYIADFALVNLGLVIEIDGVTHSSDAQIAYDKARDDFIRGQGFEIIRLWNHDIYNNLDNIMAALRARVEELSESHAPHPPRFARFPFPASGEGHEGVR